MKSPDWKRGITQRRKGAKTLRKEERVVLGLAFV